MIFNTLLLRIFQYQSQSHPQYSVIRPILIDNFNQTKPFHYLQNTNYLNKSFLTGYDEPHHFNMVELEEPPIEYFIEKFAKFNLMHKLLQNISIIEKLKIFEKYTDDTITIYNVTNGGLYDDWNNVF